MLLDIAERGVIEFSGHPIIIFFLLKRIGFASWPDITLIIHYWQEIFLMTLTSDSEAILLWYHCIACGVSRTIEHVVNLNMTWLYFFVFVWFHSFTCTVGFLLNSLFTYSTYLNKTGWLQNKHEQKTFLRKHFVIFWTTAHTSI